MSRSIVLALFYSRMLLQITVFPDCFVVISGHVRVVYLAASIKVGRRSIEIALARIIWSSFKEEDRID